MLPSATAAITKCTLKYLTPEGFGAAAPEGHGAAFDLCLDAFSDDSSSTLDRVLN
jgi:hypothetical protein